MKRQRLDELDILIESAVGDGMDEFDEFENLDISNVEFSPSYGRRKRKIIRRYKYAPMIATVKKICSRVAMFVCIILAAGFITIMSVSALRDAVINAVLEWYNDYVSIRFETESDTEGIIESIADETEKTWEAVMKARRPREIPDGVEEVVHLDSKSRVLIDYYYQEIPFASYSQTLLNEQNAYVDNDAVIIQYIKIHGNDAILFESTIKSEQIIIWNDGIYIYTIVLCGDGDLISMAKSVE